jgi:hypothetical protein
MTVRHISQRNISKCWLMLMQLMNDDAADEMLLMNDEILPR